MRLVPLLAAVTAVTVLSGCASDGNGFTGGGQAAFQIDCNRGTATWKAESAAADSGSLIFGPIGLTRMFCPQPSQDAKVAAALGEVRSYLLADGKLHLSMQADSGIMNWEPVAAGS